jgi:hypothetical protein
VISSHAASSAGAVEAALYVDGELVRVDSAASSTEDLVNFEQPWTPPGPGLYQIEVRGRNQVGEAGPSADILVQVGGVVTELTEVVTPDLFVSGCPIPDDETKLYVNETDGYCFLYPADHEEGEALSGAATLIYHPLPEGSGEQLTTSFTVTIEPAQGQSMSQYSSDKIEQAKIPGSDPDEISFSLDGEDAVWTEDLPSQAGARIGYLVHSGKGFTLALIPNGGDFDDINLQAENLWMTITTSWQWLDAAAATATATAAPDSGEQEAEGSFNANANCRQGPDTAYNIVTSFLAGDVVTLDGRNDFAPRWWYVLIPSSSAHCWVSGSTLDVSGPVEELPVIAAPLLPTDTPTATITPTNTAAPVPPAAPDNLSVSDSCTGSGLDVQLTWDDNSNNENGFRVYREGILQETLPANTTGYNQSAPHTNSGFTYSVEAFNSAGTSSQTSANSSVCPVP